MFSHSWRTKQGRRTIQLLKATVLFAPTLNTKVSSGASIHFPTSVDASGHFGETGVFVGSEEDEEKGVNQPVSNFQIKPAGKKDTGSSCSIH